MNEMKDRIKIFLEQSGLTAAQLADKMGVQRSSFSHILNGRNKPSADFISKLLTSYPELNANWFFGTSENMWLNQRTKNREGDQLSLYNEEIPAEKRKKENDKNIVADTEGSSAPAASNGSMSRDRDTIKKIVFFHENHTFTIYNPK